jgi:hypothetical protein
MSDLVDRLWENDTASALTNEAAREIERLQRVIDGRPSMTASVLEWREWSAAIYKMDVVYAIKETEN